MKADYTAILGVVLFLNVAAMLFLGHLISFHIYLQKVGMTTFEYIQYKEDKVQYKSKIFTQVNKNNDENTPTPPA